MKGAVIYHSRYGNNRKVAAAIMDGLVESGHDLVLIDAKENVPLPEDVEFVVVGSPTRAGRMSSPVKKYIKNHLADPRWKGVPFAAFGTCMASTCEKGEMTSAKDIYETLEQEGFSPRLQPFEGPVEKMKGPLVEGHDAKAREYGAEVGEALG
jgi:menaquinone-dependent protoporphyrinogen IX oxidase